MTRTLVVIQARLGSTRFPGKMLESLAGTTLLSWVVTRAKQSRMADRIIVATTTAVSDDRLVAACRALNVEVLRGPVDDVLARFVAVVNTDSAEQVVRICADNPFVDPSIMDEAIKTHRDFPDRYVYNHRPHGVCNYADGFGVEVVSRELLRTLSVSRLSDSHREHVTLALVDGTVSTRLHGCPAPPDLARPDLRFDVDTPADLARLEDLVTSSGLDVNSTAREILAAHDIWVPTQ